MDGTTGWVKIYRQALDNPVITKSFEHIGIWLYLLLNAAHKQKDVLLKGRRFTLEPGQLITTRAHLIGITETATLTARKARDILDDFEREKMIVREGQKGNSGGTLITITNWAAYQTGEAPEKDDSGHLTTVKIKCPPAICSNGRSNGEEMPTSPATAGVSNGRSNGEKITNQTAGGHLKTELSTEKKENPDICRPFNDRQNKKLNNGINNNNNNIYINTPADDARAREETPPAPPGLKYAGRDPETGKPLFYKTDMTPEEIDAAIDKLMASRQPIKLYAEEGLLP